MNKQLNYSTGVFHTNDIDDKSGTVKFYYANFNSVDNHGRKMSPKAFNRTIKNNKDKIYHLLNHNQDQVIGKPLEFGTDSEGAWVVSKLANTDKGKETLQLYRDGIYKYASFGFYILNSSEEGSIEMVHEAKIVEVSTVLYPANDLAQTISVNDALVKDDARLQEILTRLDKIDEAQARLLALEKHQTPLPNPDTNLNEVDEVITFLNSKY